MSAEKSVEDLLAEAAAATHAANPPKPKKDRKPKEGAELPEKAPRTPREPRQAKQYPQANEDGSQKFEGDGVTPVMGPKETAWKAPKKERAPKLYPQYNEAGEPLLDAEGSPIMGETKPPKKAKVARVGKVSLSINGEAVNLTTIQNEAHIQVVGNIGSKEGSKRAERAAAFSGVSNVAEFFAKGGLTKDLLRHLKTGAVKLEVPGRGVVSVDAPSPTAGRAEGQAADTATLEGAAQAGEVSTHPDNGVGEGQPANGDQPNPDAPLAQ